MRSLFAGTTDYSPQSFDDLLLDLEAWAKNLKETSAFLPANIKKLKESKYWDKVDIDFQNILHYSIKFYDTSIGEITEILGELQEEIRPDHITRIHRLCQTASKLSLRYGRIWHQEYHDKEYGNKDFRAVEELYEQGRSMAIDMMDLSNLAARLGDFVGKKNRKKPKTRHDSDVFELKPNFYGLGVNLKELIKKFIKTKKNQN